MGKTATTRSWRSAIAASAGRIGALGLVASCALALALDSTGCAQGLTDGADEADGAVLPAVDAAWAGEPVDGVRDAGDGAARVADADAGVDASQAEAGCSGTVVVNEVQVEGTTAAFDEFVELHNPTPCAVAVGQWKVEYRSRSGAAPTVVHQFSAGATLAAGSYFVLAGVSFGGPKDAVVTQGLDPGGAQIGLLDAAGKLVDGVGYGLSTSGPFVEASPAASPPGGTSIARRARGADTNNNNADFQVGTSSPRAANP